MSDDVQLFPLHKDHVKRQDIINQCCNILNYEWPRSETIRLRSLTSSCDELPACLALVRWFLSGPSVIGHARVTKIPSNPRGVWIESVVVHPDLRGKGWGKYLMLKVEDYCFKKLGSNVAYLCTVDKQPFYSRIGYTFCAPITSYGGNPKLITHFAMLQNSTVVNSDEKSILQDTEDEIPLSPIPAIQNVIERQIDSVINHKYTDVAVTCAENFQKPKLPNDPPPLDSPPRRLPTGVKSAATLPKETRIRLNKDYMKKKLP